jgi:outer membrane protein assembly factor BamB
MSVRRRGSFFCLDPSTGKTLWESDEPRRAGYASVINAGNVWLALTETGELVVVRASAKQYTPIAEYKVSSTQTWAHPVYLGDRILIRDQTTLRALSIKDDGK